MDHLTRLTSNSLLNILTSQPTANIILPKQLFCTPIYISKFDATEMSDFKAEMHQIRFPLGLRPRPRWGSLQHSPNPPSCI